MNRKLTFGALRSEAVAWVKRDLRRTARIAGISFAASWLINFAIATTKGGSWGNILGAASEGSETSGTIFMGLLTLIVTAMAAYGIEAGWADLRRSFRALPAAIGRMLREHGHRMWSIVFWATAVALFTSGVIKPTVAAVLALGFIAFAPTAITGLLGRVLTRLWTAVIGLFAPGRRPRPPGLGGQMVAMIGSAIGFVVATQGTETAFKLIAAGVLAAASYLVLVGASTRAATTTGLALIGLAAWLAGDAVAQAFQGCCGEGHHHPMDPGWAAAGVSAIAGAAGAGGGVVGAAIGSVLAGYPQDPATWGDDDPGGGARVTTDPMSGPPGKPTTITLQGDEARAALDAWRRANAEGGEADIPIPEDQQWDVYAADADGTAVVRQGHQGNRGRVTGIGGVVESGDDIVISVDITPYTPGAAPPAPPPPTPAATEVPTAAEPESTIVGESDAPDAARPASEATPSEPATPPPPPPPSPPTPSADPEPPTPPPPAPATGAGSKPPAPPPPDEPAEASTDEQPETAADDPASVADWAERAVTGTVPPDDASAIGALIRGERDEVMLSGRFTGRWAPLLGRTEPRLDGVAVRTPTGDRIVVVVRDGKVEVRHEASLLSICTDKVAEEAKAIGLDIPKVEDLVTNVKGPLDRLNQALAGTGRRLDSIVRNGDGSITITTTPAG